MDLNGFYLEQGATKYTTAVAGEQTKLLKSGAGVLHYLKVANTTASKIYVFVFDSLTATGTLLLAPTPIAANDDKVLVFPGAIPFSTGCCVSTSSTQTSYTAGGANDLQMTAVTK